MSNQMRDSIVKKMLSNDMYKEKVLKCPKCLVTISETELLNNNSVCPFCDFHQRLTKEQRIQCTTDSFKQFTPDKHPIVNPLDIAEYEKKQTQLKESGKNEAYVAGVAKIKDVEFIFGVLDPTFMMGSMGSYVGEYIAHSFIKAAKMDLPIVIFSASGGARMQEGIFSLMQMPKTTAALAMLNDNGNLFISGLMDPTTGGVTASYASLGDINISEPGSLIGFTGRRVIEQTIGVTLPDNFQTAEHQLECGFLDKIVHRNDMKDFLYNVLKMHQGGFNNDNYFAKLSKKGS